MQVSINSQQQNGKYYNLNWTKAPSNNIGKHFLNDKVSLSGSAPWGGAQRANPMQYFNWG